MRAIVTVVAFLALLGSSKQAEAQAKGLPRCNVGADPVDLLRQPTADEEVVANPADHAVRVTSGSGHISYCILQSGIQVVVDKSSGVAKWVYGCGNDLLTQWVLKRSPTAAPVAPQTLGVHHTFDPLEVHVTGAIDLNVQGAINAALHPEPRASSSACGSTCKTLLVIGGIVAGGFAGYEIHKGGKGKKTDPELPVVITLPPTGG